MREKKIKVLIGRRPVIMLNTDVTKCHVTSEILNDFPDNGMDHDKLCKPLLLFWPKYVEQFIVTSPIPK